jgi:hypothetical protein
MKNKEPTIYIREMLQNFQMPGTDAMLECMFSPDENSLWDSGVFISISQSQGFYKDIFQFWVRALFCFFEGMADNTLLQSVAPFVACKEISPKEFEQKLLTLVRQHVVDKHNREKESFSVSQIELQKRLYQKSYFVLGGSDIESSVAESDGEYIAYFHRIKSCKLLVRPPTAP